MWDILIKGATIMSTGQKFVGDLAVSDGRIDKIATSLDGPAKETIDAQGLILMPGVIDTQVHLREPGLTHKEDLETGGRSAVLGGVTTFLEMPNTNPPTTTPESIGVKVDLASGRSYANFGFFMGATDSNLESLKKVADVTGCSGIKIFLGSSTGDLLLYDAKILRQIFRETSGIIAIHSEDEERLIERKPIRDAATSPLAHPEWRDVSSALDSTTRVVALAREENRSLHILHITTKEEIDFLAQNKDLITVEVTPQHLTLHSPDCYERLGTLAQMNPPIRSKDHQDGLWKGISDGTVDVIGSDHAPHTLEEKNRGYPNSPSGMPGLQTTLPLMLNHVNQGRLTLERMIDLLCKRPSTLYNLNSKGDIKEGLDADLVLVDLGREHVLKNSEMATKCGWSPFDGVKVTGMPVKTIVGGKVVMSEGKIIGSPEGKPIPSFNQRTHQ